MVVVVVVGEKNAGENSTIPAFGAPKKLHVMWSPLHWLWLLWPIVIDSPPLTRMSGEYEHLIGCLGEVSVLKMLQRNLSLCLFLGAFCGSGLGKADVASLLPDWL